MSTPQVRNRGVLYDDSSDDSSHENNNRIKPTSNLRRRHNAAKASNGDYRLGASPKQSPERKRDGEADVGPRRESITIHGFPKSLTPILPFHDTALHDAKLEAYGNPPRPGSPNRQEADLEGQQFRNTTIAYDHENSFHASNLTTDSLTDFNNSCALSDDDDAVEYQKGKSMQKIPSVHDESEKSFGHEGTKSYESENNDEPLTINNNSDDSNRSEASEKNEGWTRENVVAKFQQSRRIVGKIVNNEFVQLAIIVLICANAILLGFMTTSWIKGNDAREEAAETADQVFLIIFTVEIAMQFYYYFFALFLDWWLVFDFVVVAISWFGYSRGNGGLSVLRAIRIVRAFRLVTRLKPLRDLVLALGEVLPRMSAIVALLFVTFYVYAVLFTELYSEMELSEKYFKTLHDSIVTCFQMMTMEWIDICREVMLEHKYAWWTFVSFVLIAGFIVFNLIVAVVVEAVSATEETVRQLDGLESNSPKAKLEEAQERIDLLQSHLNEMMEQQEQIQFMLETMAGELLHLETERMKAKYRENRLREEINRHKEEKATETMSKISNKFMNQIKLAREKRKQEEEEAEKAQAVSDHDSASQKTKPRKSAALSRDNSGKSLGSHSLNSNRSTPNTLETPKSAKSKKEKLDPNRSSSLKRPTLGARASTTGTDTTKTKAINNWKRLLAVNKEANI